MTSAQSHIYTQRLRNYTEHSSDTDTDEDWRAPISCSAAQMDTEADGDHCNQVQIRARSIATPNSGLSPKYKSAPETSPTVNYGDMSGTAQGADKKKHQCSVCKKSFGTKRVLQQHKGVHTGDKPFSCSTCEKTFSKKAHLHEHLKCTPVNDLTVVQNVGRHLP
ncbi:hypothetical protein NQD34_012443 [Periophthalmus magnuspinnatus]|nr:hypothetical protein NQD34_012443 [Periophthalmus magnuspinnatus]